MNEEAREAQRAYNRAWRKKNAEHVKAYRVQYWAKKAKEAEEEK